MNASFMRCLLVALIQSLMTASALFGAPISGTKAIGPSGDYTSIGAAITDIQARTLDGPLILELQAAYVSTVESFPLTFTNLGTSAVNTLTLRPAAGAIGRTISSSNTTAATVDINGASFITIDGRPGGGGVVSQLTIANTSVAGVALRFINDASNNSIRYVNLRGVNSGEGGGVVVFSTTSGPNGNDNNLVDNCSIGDGASLPVNCIYAAGGAQNNNGNIISNCRVFNFNATTLVNSAGIRIQGGNSDWTITGNSFYQTATRASVAGASVRAIYLSAGSGAFTVTNNFIGGDSPNAAVTSQKWTTTGSQQNYGFVGIHFNVDKTMVSHAHGNTIRNMAWSTGDWTVSGYAPGVWSGIYVQEGAVDVGSAGGNTIGSSTGTGSIFVTTDSGGSSGADGTFGITSIGTSALAIANNTIGSITATGVNAAGGASVSGIYISNGNCTISNNLVGSNATPNSINASFAVTGISAQRVVGILCVGGSATTNVVANLNNACVGTAGTAQGIVLAGGVNSVSGNTIRNLSNAAANVDLTSNQSVCGIVNLSTELGQNVSQNTIHTLSNTSVTGAVGVTGLYSVGPSYVGDGSGAIWIARNWVHSFSISSSSSSSVMNGIQLGAGACRVQNNMVRIGIDALGNTAAPASTLRGIYDAGTDAGRFFYHNSIYVGGSQASGAANTFALASIGTTNLRIFANNIVVNSRGNSGGTGKHYAIAHGGTGANPAGLSSGGNLLFVNGLGGLLGLYNGSDQSNLTSWQVATGQDVTSAVADPLFVQPAASADAVNLHLQSANPVERGGVLVDGVVDDFDGESRDGNTPVDVGADAGTFSSSGDVFSPSITLLPLSSGTTANRTLTGFATILDNIGVSVGGNSPRLYFKKSTDADVFGVANNSSGNGWKYVAASNNTSPFSFTIDYSILNGGGVSAGNTIQYFLVCQDDAGNLISSPPGAGATVAPKVQNINAHGNVSSYTILGGTISGTKTVGTGGNYTSLSGSGGLFAAINSSVLTGDVVVNIISDLVESGSNALNQFNINDPASTFAITIQPGSASMKTLSGSNSTGLLVLNGADRVVMDGRFGGGGRYLTIRNTNSLGMAVNLKNDACGNTIRNCVIEGGTSSATLGVLSFGGAVSGNDNNLITENQIRDLSTITAIPAALIGLQASSATARSSNIISNNELFNFGSAGIRVGASLNEAFLISGNNIYQATTRSGLPVGISVEGAGNCTITNNYIHDMLTTGSDSIGVSMSGLGKTTIARNRITFLEVNSANIWVTGIRATGGAGSVLNMMNNQITIIPSGNVSRVIYGFYDMGPTGAGRVINAYFNTIFVGGAGGGTSWAALRTSPSSFTARNNLYFNNRSGGSNYAASTQAAGGSYSSNYNVFVGTGTPAANFMAYSTNSTNSPTTFSAWKVSVGGDGNSLAGNPGGDFSTAMFVNAAAGDLHIVPAGNPLVRSTGISLAEVATDYDGEVRSALAPWIGADEVLLPGIGVAQDTTLTDEVSVVDFGTVGVGSSSVLKTFTITNTGPAVLSSLVVGKSGAGANDFTVNALSRTTVPSGETATFAVSFTPGSGGVKSAALNIVSNVVGTQNPFDINITGTGQTAYQAWATANNISSDPNANAGANLLSFAFGRLPGSLGALVYSGTFAGGGAIAATGTPVAAFEMNAGSPEFRALFVRKSNHASAGLVYSCWFSEDLTTWQTSSTPPAILADDGQNQIVSVPFLNANVRFFKISVSLSP